MRQTALEAMKGEIGLIGREKPPNETAPCTTPLRVHPPSQK
jgi:hypothetical protein